MDEQEVTFDKMDQW